MTAENKATLYQEKLQRMIREETVSSPEGSDPGKFRKFHIVLEELFPHFFQVCSKEDFDGSLLLRWPGKNPDIPPVLFLNHQDVVEASGSWTHAPFSGEITDGKLWGRGTLDDKGGLWAMLQAADELAEENFVPPADIYFLSSCTEETDGSGADKITQELQNRGLHFEMCFDEGGMVMYDPIGGAAGTFAMVGVGEKGCADLKFIARSAGGHASTPGRDTPLVRLGKFMAAVEKSRLFPAKLSPTVLEMLRRFAPYMGSAGFVLRHAKGFSPLLKRILPSLSPSAGALLNTTIAFTMARGSEGTNVLPQEAWVVGNMRFSHHQGFEDSLSALQKLAGQYAVEIEILDPGFSSRITDYNGSAFRLVTQAVKATLPKVDETVPYLMTGASDSRFCDRICDQCIRFLPFCINDRQLSSIHGIDEYIDISALSPAVAYYKYLMREAQSFRNGENKYDGTN